MIMAFVNMHSAGLKILATHRLVSGVDPAGFLEPPRPRFRRPARSPRSMN